MEIRYLSHGVTETGGYRHELFLAQELHRALHQSTFVLLRQRKIFSSLNHTKLQWWAFKNANAAILVITVRLALVTLLRNAFTNNRIYIVLHNYDEKDRKPKILALYYFLLFNVISCFHKRVRVVAVAPFFQAYFEQKLKRKIYLFPNFFDTSLLSKFKTPNKQNRIHLGQWSTKNSGDVFDLAQRLTNQGIHCYFSTLDARLAQRKDHYEIVSFDRYESYLVYMAESKFTLAFPAINEGWNRVAHESVLVGTTVIGFKKGGLGNLLEESTMFMVDHYDEALKIILEDKHAETSLQFIAKYDIKNANTFTSKMLA